MCENRCHDFRKMCYTVSTPQERVMIDLRRDAIQNMINWKNDDERKPLVLRGARQVGKTWLMKEFGKNHYNNFVYFNFDE